MKVLTRLSIILILSAIFLSKGCQEQHNMQKLQDQVDAINDQMINAIMNNDPESTLALYKEDAISLPSYQPMMKGMDAFKEQMEKQKEMPMNFQTFTLTSTDLLVSGKFVVDVGTYDMSM
jgi:ketosteroid isomerase-like protein